MWEGRKPPRRHLWEGRKPRQKTPLSLSRLPPLPQGRSPPPRVPPQAPAADLPIEQRRTRIAEAVAALPHVTGAHWATPSTLRVDTSSKTFDPRSICPLLEQDPELGAARLQVQYPAGSERPVRFLQCRAY